jgi:hypothetical protein
VTIGPRIVDRVAEHVDHASDERVANRHLHDAAGALYEIAFFDRLKLAKQHRADFVFFEVQRQTANVVRKLEQFAGHDFFKAMKFSDAVADLDDRSDFGDRDAVSKFSICLRIISLISLALIGSMISSKH